jgi:hypothetical protein
MPAEQGSERSFVTGRGEAMQELPIRAWRDTLCIDHGAKVPQDDSEWCVGHETLLPRKGSH